MPKNSDDQKIDQDFADFDDEFVKDVGAAPAGTIEYPPHEELISKINFLEDQLARTKAELANVIKRGEAEVAKTHKYATERFARELLAVVDNLERALEQKVETENTLRTGVEMTLKILQSTLEKFAIKPINPVGETFDPGQQEAMSIQETADHVPGTVMTVLQKGYLLHDRLLRPAMVIVAKAPQKN
jgi:molecular chaperone GrpE